MRFSLCSAMHGTTCGRAYVKTGSPPAVLASFQEADLEKITASWRRVIKVAIEQTQTNTGLFQMPLDVVITTASGDQTFVAQDKLKSQDFEFVVNENKSPT